VMAVAARLIQRATDNAVARSVAAACEPHLGQLLQISDRVDIPRLHTALRRLFEQKPESETSVEEI